MNRRYTKAQVDEIRFYQLPKALLENPKYRKLSDSAKVTYAILRDRQDLSIKNQWYDDNGHVFCYFDGRKLSELQGSSPSTIHRNKKQLIKYGLMEDQRLGQGKPNRLYILKPETVENTLIYNYDKSSDTDMTKQDLSNLVQSDTKFNETENNDTENLLILKNEVDCPYVKTYINAYQTYIGDNHPKVRESDIDVIENFIYEVEEEVEDFKRIVNGYFEDLPRSNNGNILAFIKAWPRVSDMYY